MSKCWLLWRQVIPKVVFCWMEASWNMIPRPFEIKQKTFHDMNGNSFQNFMLLLLLLMLLLLILLLLLMLLLLMLLLLMLLWSCWCCCCWCWCCSYFYSKKNCIQIRPFKLTSVSFNFTTRAQFLQPNWTPWDKFKCGSTMRICVASVRLSPFEPKLYDLNRFFKLNKQTKSV